MPKVEYLGTIYDSQLEVDYVKYLKSNYEVLSYVYHPKEKIEINKSNRYTPDFIVRYDDRYEIIETKGYSQFSFMRDNLIHSYMKELTEEQLRTYVIKNIPDANKSLKVVYRKIKHNATYGWVDWEWKNPNTIAKKRKAKIDTQQNEIKQLKAENKMLKRYFELTTKDKLTKAQLEKLTELKIKLKIIFSKED